MIKKQQGARGRSKEEKRQEGHRCQTQDPELLKLLPKDYK